jgi:hypothetical protein
MNNYWVSNVNASNDEESGRNVGWSPRKALEKLYKIHGTSVEIKQDLREISPFDMDGGVF